MITFAFQLALSIVIVGTPLLFMVAWGLNILPDRFTQPAIHQYFHQHISTPTTPAEPPE
jgi:hypothetical protein